MNTYSLLSRQFSHFLVHRSPSPGLLQQLALEAEPLAAPAGSGASRAGLPLQGVCAHMLGHVQQFPLSATAPAHGLAPFTRQIAWNAHA